ncbi:MAG: alpha/beta hydrolase [Coleofasciculaceae cyanobacterium]
MVKPLPAQGAEKIYVGFGPLEFSLPISALEVYAAEGIIEPELAFYAGLVEPEQLERLRTALVTPVDATPVMIAQFLYSPQGEIILDRVGEIIETKARQPGFFAIRASLIKASARREGLTLLNVLREFPTYGIRVNSGRAFELIEELSKLIQETQVAIAAVEENSQAEAFAQIESRKSLMRPILETAQDPTGFSEFPELREPGTVGYSMQTITLNDVSRRRSFPVDLYLPQQLNSISVPVIVISHGLGSERETFAYLAKHLASYGFAVAVPEHPGSNAGQIEALLNGFASEVTSPRELLDRPLDIKFLLDELEKSFSSQLNLQNVGVIGQSFGGYTALALAGAKFNFEQLQEDCGQLNDTLNLSLLLQCIAIKLPIEDYPLKDERVKGILAINPIGSELFGQSGFGNIQVPTTLVSGSDDTVAPALPEQIKPFTWLNIPNKYLVLLRKGTHFSTLAPSTGGIPLPERVIGPDPLIAADYMKALSVAFFQTYLASQLEYEPYLSASYAQFLSQDKMPLYLVESLTQRQLMKLPSEEKSN